MSRKGLISLLESAITWPRIDIFQKEKEIEKWEPGNIDRLIYRDRKIGIDGEIGIDTERDKKMY